MLFHTIFVYIVLNSCGLVGSNKFEIVVSNKLLPVGSKKNVTHINRDATIMLEAMWSNLVDTGRGSCTYSQEKSNVL